MLEKIKNSKQGQCIAEDKGFKMQSFNARVYAKYQVESKLSGLLEHPISERLKLLKKVKPEKGSTTVLGYDLLEGVWSKLFTKFAAVVKEYNVTLKPPLDKTPHVTLAYIINATAEEIEKAKESAKAITTPFRVNGVLFLKGKQTKDFFVVLTLQVNKEFRKVFNAIENMVGRQRVVEFRTIWHGHVPHASIGIISDFIEKNKIKEIETKLSKIVKTEQIAFMPKFVEVHKNTGKVGGPFVPEMIDYTSLVDE